jgi:NodT family efflux transporter outer membrane factor (OMF) lipoprotein
MKRRMTKAFAATCACLVAGCAVGPDFRPPAPPTASRYTAEPLPPAAQTTLVEGRDIPAEWWTVFQVPALDELMRQALARNPDLQAAGAALRVARESVLAQRGALFPSVTGQYNATRQSVATAVSSPLESGANTFTLHTAQLSVGYTPDVFGGTRRQIESVQAQAEVQRQQLEATHLTLSTNLVSTVIQRASTRAQIDATQAMVGASGQQLALLRRQQALGQIGTADVAAQETALAQLRATLPPLEKQWAQQGNQLAVLIGSIPSDAALPDVALDALLLPHELPLSLPSTLVEQRPDIRAATAQMHAASAQIGVAVANRLPSFNLTTGLGSSAQQFSRLFGAGTGFWSLGADVVQPIFDAGTLKHRQRAAEATYEQTAAQYRGTVLVAFQNVADTLNAIDADARAFDAAMAAERAAERSLAIARRQQAAGLVGVLSVLNAELAWRQTSLARIQAQASRLADAAALFQALGGGWWNRAEPLGAVQDRAAAPTNMR